MTVRETELQLSPREPDDAVGDMDLPSEKDLAVNWGPDGRGEVNPLAHWRTCFIDVQDRALFWAVCAWAQDFTGWLVDYDVWPRQKRPWFDYTMDILRKPNVGLQGDSVDQAICKGLDSLTKHLSGRYAVDSWIVDSGNHTDTIVSWCASSPLSPLPSQGLGLGPEFKPISEWSSKSKKRRVGLNWFVEQRQLRFDANRWKTFLFQRIMATGPGAFRFPVNESHELLAYHLRSETPILKPAPTKGRELFVWNHRPGRDNHWLDCLIGCCVAGSMLGAQLPEHKSKKKTPRRKRRASFSVAE